MDSLLLLLVGLLGLGGGVMNILGYITASPRANRKVPEEFRRVYGRCVGAGTALIGAAFCAVGILRWVAYSQQVELVILTVGSSATTAGHKSRFPAKRTASLGGSHFYLGRKVSSVP